MSTPATNGAGVGNLREARKEIAAAKKQAAAPAKKAPAKTPAAEKAPAKTAQ